LSATTHGLASALRRLPAKPGALLAGALLFVALLVIDTPLRHWGEFGSRPALAAALTALMALWWITEALPIYATACLPLLILPWGEVHGPGLAANALGALRPYVDPYIFLFLGGMGIAAAMAQWNLHRRIALGIMRVVGTDPRRLLAGLLLATASVSLWISNTATAAMMLPIALAVIGELEHHSGKRLARYGAALMLAVAYAANVGGIGTKIGTVPSAQLSGVLAQRGTEVSFLGFMAVGVPFVALMLPVLWLGLWRIGRDDAVATDVGQTALEREAARLGPMQRGEWVVLGVFAAAVAAWIAGKPLADALDLATAHVEAGVAMLASAALMLWRVDGRRALELRALRGVQWSTLLLLGGGFSMAAAITASGLSHWLGAQLGALRAAPPLAQVGAASLISVALSAFASNTATVAVMLPVLGGTAAVEHADAVLFAAAFAASCDFALPAGTPPNAIVFGSGYLTIPLMARTGVWLDLAAALLAAGWCWLAVPRLL
jgi:sodium-dependent dicarboxylate transporter 2/3/5